MKKEIKGKGKDMTAPEYGGGEGLLLIKGRAELEVGTSGGFQSGHDQTERGHVRKGGEEEREESRNQA